MIVAVSPAIDEARELIRELDTEIAALYPELPTNGINVAEFEKAGGCFVIAREAGQATGCGAYRPLDDRCAEIKRMFVRRTARPERGGVDLCPGAASQILEKQKDGPTEEMPSTPRNRADFMSLKEAPGPHKAGLVQTKKKFNPIRLATRVIFLAAGINLLAFVKTTAADTPQPAATERVTITGPMTFSKDVAPILFENCVNCHRPGQSAPFNLLTFADAKKRARDIARVTARRIMPPWLPEHGYGEFRGERRLTDRQIAILQQWVNQGSPEGNPGETPKAPEFTSVWQLGEPDLVVEPTEAFVLPAQGKDIYFNFVMPIPVTQTRYVSAVELLPGNRAVHHAFIEIDPTRTSRRKGTRSHPAGFAGMDLPETASMPGGQLLGWQPGKILRPSARGLAWTLRTNTDLVLQTHLNPQGKPENVRPRLGLHFTSQVPANKAFRLRLTALELDIPAGTSNYVAEMSYPLPKDLSFVRVGGHAHYLCKEMQGYAILPGGAKKWLLFIRNWDFKWQGDYEYKTPVDIPKGSTIVMRFTYDNSTNNVRNPFSPPRRVLHGPETTDEMGELYFQTMPRDQADYEALLSDYLQYDARVNIDYYRFRLKMNPGDAEALLKLGRALAWIGRTGEAITYLEKLARLEPTNDLPHFDLGSIYLRQGRASRAYQEFRNVVRLNPEDGQAYESLGIICAQTHRLDEAREHFMKALRIDPEDTLAAQYLQRLNAQGR